MNTSTNYNFNLPDYNDTADIEKLSENFFNLDSILTQIAADIADLKDIAISGEITVSDVLLMAHPVGSTYQSANSTSPAMLFGGTWQRLEDVFIVAAGENHEAGSTGGETTHVHDLSDNGYALLALKGNGQVRYREKAVTSWQDNYYVDGSAGYQSNDSQTYGAALGGATDSANNEPPYIAMYTWVRTA